MIRTTLGAHKEFQRVFLEPRSRGSGYQASPGGAGRRQARAPHFVQRCGRSGMKSLSSFSPKVRLCDRAMTVSHSLQRGTISPIVGG